MFKSMFTCCGQRDSVVKSNEPSSYGRISNGSKQYIESLNQINDLLRLKKSNSKMSFTKLIKKITYNTHDSTIHEDDFKELIEEFSVDEETGEIDPKTRHLLAFSKRDYFYCEEDIICQIYENLDALKVKLFLFLVLRDDKACKVKLFVQTIAAESSSSEMKQEKNYLEGNRVVRDLDRVELDQKRKERILLHARDPYVILVMSLLFAGAILPFVDYYNETEHDGKDYEFSLFLQLATTNKYIFQSFSTYFADNYLFFNTPAHEEKSEFTLREFENLCMNSYDLLFDPKKIRKLFLKFATNNKEKCLRRPSESESKSQHKSELYVVKKIESDDEPVQGQAENLNFQMNPPISTWKRMSVFRAKGKQQNFFNEDKEVPVFRDGEEEKSISVITPDKCSYKEIDMTDSRLKLENTGVTLCKSNTLTGMDKSKEIKLENSEFQKYLECKFGAELLTFLQNHFQNYIIKEAYKCAEEECGYERVRKMDMSNSFKTSPNESLVKNSFNHSYRYNSLRSVNDKVFAKLSAQDYCNNAIKNKISMRDFKEYYMGDQNCENLVNAYLRLLEVYSELKDLQTQYENPDYIPVGIKIFETNYLDEFIMENHTGVISDAIDEELQDFLDQQFLIIPANINGRTVAYIVELPLGPANESPSNPSAYEEEEIIKVDLYLIRDDKLTEEEEQNFNERCSIVIVDLLARAFDVVIIPFNVDNIDAKVHETENLSMILQEIENKVCGITENQLALTEDKIKHKVIDRLSALIET
ncbi:unnamed protein product [Moneuplotes crassus]|uniref:Uncharacterized protein n=1 Tax=Euplotes crassus TaxID=5936 RepID=A0AAD2D8F7_EUPCR|nr:unnamed protein product [Moneuplotes crassus]